MKITPITITEHFSYFGEAFLNFFFKHRGKFKQLKEFLDVGISYEELISEVENLLEQMCRDNPRIKMCQKIDERTVSYFANVFKTSLTHPIFDIILNLSNEELQRRFNI